MFILFNRSDFEFFLDNQFRMFIFRFVEIVFFRKLFVLTFVRGKEFEKIVTRKIVGPMTDVQDIPTHTHVCV